MHNSLEQLTAYGNVELHTSPHTNTATSRQNTLLWRQALALLREELPRQGTNTAKQSGR